jgi:hypothetical protein
VQTAKKETKAKQRNQIKAMQSNSKQSKAKQSNKIK